MAPKSYVLKLKDLRQIAHRELRGVGDDSKQWEVWTGIAFHLRRRLTEEEQSGIGEVVDIRGTAEAKVRAINMGPHLKRIPPEMLREELGR